MYQQNNAERAGDSLKKTTLGDRFWQFVRFVVVTGMIFTLSFFAINFSAYREILLNELNPKAQAQAEKALEVSITPKKAELSSGKFLPVLPDTKDTRKVFDWVDFPIAPTDNRIIIPKLGKSIPIIEMGTEHIEGENWAELEKQIQGGLQKGVVRYPGTAKAGQFGNIFITGHSSYYPWDSGKFKDVFALLAKLESGDMFYIYSKQVKYSYRVYNKIEVQPTNVDVLFQPKDKKIATLMTCTPVGTALRRLIIQAEQV
ncbi:sortase [Candidatus Peregrinibacteria bacterium]|nr:sortase [Candidatus Peregrinibacteria bacterium]